MDTHGPLYSEWNSDSDNNINSFENTIKDNYKKLPESGTNA